MKPHEQYEKAQASQEWASCDPVTLVAAAREGLYQLPDSQRDTVAGPLEEIISRFDQTTRATSGVGGFVGAGQQQLASTGRRSG